MTTAHAEPNPHPLHDQLLLAFLDSSLSLPQIAHHFALTLTALAVWVRSPLAQADIEGFRQIARYRAVVLADGALPAAVDTFIRINHHLANLEGPPRYPHHRPPPPGRHRPQGRQRPDPVRPGATTRRAGGGAARGDGHARGP